MNDVTGILRRLDRTGWPLLAARLVLGGVFLVLGWDKAGDPVAFAKQIRQYQMLPDDAFRVLNAVAVCLPWVEMVCGGLLILGVWVRGSALALLILLTVFTAAIVHRAIGIHASDAIAWCAIKFDCGCGSGEQYVCHKVPENIGLWLLALIALLSRSRRFCLGRDGIGPAPGATVIDQPPGVSRVDPPCDD